MGHNPFEGETRQWIEATIDRQADYFEVQLFERDADGNTLGSRRLREQASDCHKLDDAMVLAIALIIDPSAQLAPAPTNPVQALAASSAPSAASSASAPLASRSVSSSLPTRPALGAGPEASGVMRAVMTPKRAESRLGTAFVSADAVVLHGVLPGIPFGAELVTRLALDARERAALRVSALVLPETIRQNQGRLGYGLTALEAGGCLQEDARQWAIFGCAGFGLGAVHVVVYDPNPLDPDDRLWAAFRFEGGVAARIAGPVWVQARLFDLVPLRRWDFRVVRSQDGTATETPVAFGQSWFMPGAALGLGLHFD